MQRISQIGSLLKKIYRNYSSQVLSGLREEGYLDLRPSFLEILSYVCQEPATSIRQIGAACGLKKQTMTSHLNELEKRGYILRATNEADRREQVVRLTEYGEKFKLSLIKVVSELEEKYIHVIGALEMERVETTLNNYFEKANFEGTQSAQQLLI